MPITTKVVSLNLADGKVYSIQHYMILSVTGYRSVVFSTNKTVSYDITEILLKVALNTIPLTFHISNSLHTLISKQRRSNINVVKVAPTQV